MDPNNNLEIMEWLTDQLLFLIDNKSPQELGFNLHEWFKCNKYIIRWNFTGQHRFLPLVVLASKHNKINQFMSLRKYELDLILKTLREESKIVQNLRDNIALIKQLEQ